MVGKDFVALSKELGGGGSLSLASDSVPNS